MTHDRHFLAVQDLLAPHIPVSVDRSQLIDQILDAAVGYERPEVGEDAVEAALEAFRWGDGSSNERMSRAISAADAVRGMSPAPFSNEVAEALDVLKDHLFNSLARTEEYVKALEVFRTINNHVRGKTPDTVARTAADGERERDLAPSDSTHETPGAAVLAGGNPPISDAYVINNSWRGMFWLSPGNGVTEDIRQAYRYTKEQALAAIGGEDSIYSIIHESQVPDLTSLSDAVAAVREVMGDDPAPAWPPPDCYLVTRCGVQSSPCADGCRHVNCPHEVVGPLNALVQRVKATEERIHLMEMRPRWTHEKEMLLGALIEHAKISDYWHRKLTPLITAAFPPAEEGRN